MQVGKYYKKIKIIADKTRTEYVRGTQPILSILLSSSPNLPLPFNYNIKTENNDQ